MVKRSNKQIGEILAETETEAKLGTTADKKEHLELDRKITLATEGFTAKFCQSLLSDRSRLSKEITLVLRLCNSDEKRDKPHT
jgi:hypothetical protein